MLITSQQLWSEPIFHTILIIEVRDFYQKIWLKKILFLAP